LIKQFSGKEFFMNTYKITCGSTCDLTAEHLKKIGVEYLPYHYIIDGVAYADDLYISETPAQFYGKITAGALPTTAQITPSELVDFLTPLLKQGFDVLHIEFSSGLSGSYQSALKAQKQLQEQFPERKILVVDSLAASSGYGLLVDKAASLQAEGKSMEEVKDWIEANRLRVRHWFFSTSLTHYKRGGRISGPAAAIGNMLNICPLMDVNSEGKLIIRKKLMGKKKTCKEVLEIMAAQAEGGYDYNEKCYISHSFCPNDAEALRVLAEKAFPSIQGGIEMNMIGTVIGSHTGVGTVAIYYFSHEDRTL
jgi:DegV family protein with EDD domain